MTPEELDDVAATLGDSLVVIGCGPVGQTASQRVDTTSPLVTRADAESLPADAEAAFVALDPTAPETAVDIARRCRERDVFSVFVAAVGPDSDDGVRDRLTALREVADAVVLIDGRDHDPVATTIDGVETLVRLVAGSDLINLDLADVETVLSSAGFATLGEWTAPTPAAAVEGALDDCGSVIVSQATGALVHLSGESVTVRAAGESVETVRDRLGEESHIIWGCASPASEQVRVRVILAGVTPVHRPGETSWLRTRLRGALPGETGDATVRGALSRLAGDR